MLRFTGCAIVVLYALTATASAEKISFQPSGGLETALDWSDPSVQQAVIAAAPVDWHDTPGADVWWVTLEGQRIQVQVFPALERPGNGEPGCCVHFVVGDSEFWLKIKGLSSPPPAKVGAGQNISHPPGENGHGPVRPLESLKPVTTWPDGAAGESILPDEGLLSHLAPSGDPLNSSGSSSGSSGAERLESEGGSTESQVALAQVPEPGLLMLMGLGAAALKRARTRPLRVR